MTEQDNFLLAITENPDEDAVRLVYSDWLEDRGDPRGEFIKVQCRLARMSADDSDRAVLENRERRLLEEYQEEWLGPLKQWAVDWTFYRGFLETLTVPVPIYLDHAEELWDQKPQVRLLVDLRGAQIPQQILEMVPEAVARENLVIPIGKRGKRLVMGMCNPLDTETIQKLCFIFNRDIEPVGVPPDQFVLAVDRLYDGIETDSSNPHHYLGGEDDLDEFSAPIVKLVDLILYEAFIQTKATAIRIEPFPDRFEVQYLINGEWSQRDSPPMRLLPAIISRLRYIAIKVKKQLKNEQEFQVATSMNGHPIEAFVKIENTPNGPRLFIRK